MFPATSWAVKGVGNFWDSDLAMDLDHDGINDLPHRELDSVWHFAP